MEAITYNKGCYTTTLGQVLPYYIYYISPRRKVKKNKTHLKNVYELCMISSFFKYLSRVLFEKA